MMHWTSLDRDPSVLTLPSAGHGTSLDRDPSLRPLLMISGYHHWRPVHICSLQDPPADICWLLKHNSRRIRAVRILQECCTSCFTPEPVSSLSCCSRSNLDSEVETEITTCCKYYKQEAETMRDTCTACAVGRPGKYKQCEETSLMACGLSVDIIGMQKHRRKSR